MQIINETRNLFTQRRQHSVCRSRSQAFCPKCKTQVGLINDTRAAEFLKTTSPEIYQMAEAGKIHRAHNSKGEIMFCFNSVSEFENAAAEIDYSEYETLIQIDLSEI